VALPKTFVCKDSYRIDEHRKKKGQTAINTPRPWLKPGANRETRHRYLPARRGFRPTAAGKIRSVVVAVA